MFGDGVEDMEEVQSNRDRKVFAETQTKGSNGQTND